jgi:sulfopropanediol 3-dehydrogenase
MIVGPGNAYVAEAKRQLFGRVGIDLFAGPTETLVIATTPSTPSWCAVDLLGQAEHGPTRPASCSPPPRSSPSTDAAIETVLDPAWTPPIAGISWRDYGEVILCDTDEEMLAEAERHRLRARAGDDARPGLVPAAHDQLRRAVPGPRTNVSYGDKVIGTNHTLPTQGAGATPAACGSASSSRPAPTSAC